MHPVLTKKKKGWLVFDQKLINSFISTESKLTILSDIDFCVFLFFGKQEKTQNAECMVDVYFIILNIKLKSRLTVDLNRCIACGKISSVMI